LVRDSTGRAARRKIGTLPPAKDETFIEF